MVICSGCGREMDPDEPMWIWDDDLYCEMCADGRIDALRVQRSPLEKENERLLADNANLRAENERLREALRPFENVKAERLAVAGRKIAHLEEKNERLCAENKRLRAAIIQAIPGSCTCMVMSSILDHHQDGCRYRILATVLAEKEGE